ncbi:MAG: GIY-YIG nuclease family protein [Microgenomates group bacterium]
MFTVYVLKSRVNNRLYVGQTNDIERRMSEHNSGKSKYTSLTFPFDLIYGENMPTRIDALRREKSLKSGKGREWLKVKLVEQSP